MPERWRLCERWNEDLNWRNALEQAAMEGESPVLQFIVYSFLGIYKNKQQAMVESGCLRVQPQVGGILHLTLNINTRPIANKYREGKMQSTLKRESNRTWNRCNGSRWNNCTVWFGWGLKYCLFLFKINNPSIVICSVRSVPYGGYLCWRLMTVFEFNKIQSQSLAHNEPGPLGASGHREHMTNKAVGCNLQDIECWLNDIWWTCIVFLFKIGLHDTFGLQMCMCMKSKLRWLVNCDLQHGLTEELPLFDFWSGLDEIVLMGEFDFACGICLFLFGFFVEWK